MGKRKAGVESTRTPTSRRSQGMAGEGEVWVAEPLCQKQLREGGSGAERRQLSDQPQEFLLLLFRKTAGFVE